MSAKQRPKRGLEPMSAVFTRLEASEGSRAIPPTPSGLPVPLAGVIGRAGMLYHQVWRQGNAAIYRAEGESNRLEFEVIQVQILPAEELHGRSYPSRESVPSNSSWGESAWTFTDNSHRDPLAAAMAKARKLGKRTA